MTRPVRFWFVVVFLWLTYLTIQQVEIWDTIPDMVKLIQYQRWVQPEVYP